MDTYLLKLTGKAEAPERIEIGYNYHVAIEGAVVSESKSTNDDGTHTFTATFKPIKIDLLNVKGETLKMKDTRTSSQILRARFYGIWLKSGSSEDFEKWYAHLMSELINDAWEIVEKYK
jgi:hypothetical protein